MGKQRSQSPLFEQNTISPQIVDDDQGDVMDIARATLKQLKIPTLRVNMGTDHSPAYFCWILGLNKRPAIVVGYGTADPEKMSSPHHIIVLHCRKRPIFNVLSAMEDYAVKHTRVATPRVVVYDSRIPTHEPIPARDFLEKQYHKHVLNMTAAFRARNLDVPPVVPFEEGPDGHKNTKKMAKIARKMKKGKAKSSFKEKKPRRRAVYEWDDEDGPLRRLAPALNIEDEDSEEDDDAEDGADTDESDDGDDGDGKPAESTTQEAAIQDKAQKKDQDGDSNRFSDDSGIDISALGKIQHTEDGDVIYVHDDDNGDKDKDNAVQSIEKSVAGPIRSKPRAFNSRKHRVQPY